MPAPKHLYFERFQLDTQDARLLRDGQVLPLTPKSFDVLAFLCRHPGSLISKETLLDAVWQRRVVSDGVLKNTIQELRRALGDDPRAPRFIETVHRRGYRFLGRIRAEAEHMPLPADRREPANETLVVGRDESLSRLCELLALCESGRPQTVLLSGEAGIGKTTLMRQFGAQLPEGVASVRGQCVEQYGEVEPYLPLLECLNQLGRRHGRALTEALRRYAPTWLALVPWLLDDADRNAPQGSAQGLTKERMQRELCAFLEHWTGDQPHALVLMLEDLHWSDHATLDAISHLARRPGPARWMILGSYRPADMIVLEHPLRLAIGELRLHRLCHDIALELLPEGPVLEYLARRFEASPLSGRLMREISRRTEGLPLYLAHLSNELMTWREQHAESADEEMEAFLEALPESLRPFIEQQFSRLPGETQAILDAAAVSGSGFSPVMLAAVTGGNILAAEDCCERLASSRRILMRAGPPHRPERRSSGRYAFIHAYYQELAYERVPLLRRASLHLAVAEWFEAACGARVRDLAAEIATHFERGRKHERALRHYRVAVENALGRHDPHAVSALSRRALKMLEQLPPTLPEYVPIAVELYTTLAGAIQITHGWAEPELQAVFDDLFNYEQILSDSPHYGSILWALMGFHCVRGEIRLAEQYAAPLLACDHSEANRERLIYCHVAQMAAGLYTGRLAFALEHFQASQTLYSPDQPGVFPLAAVHPVVLSYYYLAKAYWLLGFPDRALSFLEQGQAVAQIDAQPYSLASIHWSRSVCHQLRGEAELAEASCRTLMALADEQGFALLAAITTIQRGWALVNLNRIEEGVDSMERGIAAFRATGARLSETYLLAYCVDAFLHVGLYEKGTALLEEVFAYMEKSGERYFEAELHRLKGETVRTSAPTDAERHFLRALETARLQGARSLELRAAISLARLWLDQSRVEPARALLSAVYSAFTEGFDTRDLIEARVLQAVMADPSLSDTCN